MTIQCAVCLTALDAPWVCPVCGPKGRLLVDGQVWERVEIAKGDQ